MKMQTQTVESSSKQHSSDDERRSIISEIYETEKKFVRDLQTIVEVYIEPLSSGFSPFVQAVIPKISQKESKIIFRDIALILKFNTKLLSEITSILISLPKYQWEHAQIGKIFVDYAPFMKMYQRYFNGHLESDILIKELIDKRADFLPFLEACMLVPRCKNLDLHALLIKPVQRD